MPGMPTFSSTLAELPALNQVAVPDLWQQQAVGALREGKDVVVQAPTGAGKTLIFELWSNQGKNRGPAIYTVPTRALAVHSPCLTHGATVPLDSPLKSLADLKDAKVLKRPAVVGTTTGSTNHFGFIAAAIAISTLGFLSQSILTAPRVYFAMADDGLFFRPVARIHPRFGTPYVAITMVAALGMAFVLLRTFEQLADAFVTAFLPFYLLAVASVFKLRGTPGYNPTFRVPLYPVVPLLFIVSVLYLLGNAIVQASSRMPTLAVLGVLLMGVPVYYLTVGRRNNRA
jgi:amino acid transporter